jgi:hypothetical protein
MRVVRSSRIMRTTLDIDPTVLNELKRRSKKAGKTIGQLASELLARSLREHGKSDEQVPFKWVSHDLGKPLVDLEDKEAVRAILDAPR